MNFTKPDKTIKTIRPSDPDFMIYNGNFMAARAGFEINQQCPNSYKKIIQECISHGWLKPVAYMKDVDYTWEKLGE
jgi:hypothetical protein